MAAGQFAIAKSKVNSENSGSGGTCKREVELVKMSNQNKPLITVKIQ